MPVCLEETIGILFDLENMAPAVYYPHTFYHSFLFWFSWICILAGLVAVMTPYVGLKAHNQEEMKKARELVKRYGQNCSSYLTLEKDKSYLFGKTVPGVIAYGIAGDVFVALGDPICAPEDFFVPFAGMNGYVADVTRYRAGAVRGVIETVFYEAMMQFKEEGIEWGSLAAAPLARLEEERDVTAKLLNLAYAIVKIQNPLGVRDYVSAFFRNFSFRKVVNKQRG